MPGQQLLRFSFQLVLAAQLSQYGLAQRGQVLQPLPQRRDIDRQHIQPVIQVGAEGPAGHGSLQVDGGGGNDAHIAAQHLVRSYRFVFLFLQHPQQLALQGQRHVADLVEEQRAAFGQLQLAATAFAVGAGKSTRRGAEEFGFQQRLRDGCAVDADKSFVCPCRRCVNGVGQQLLAGAGFAQQQHGRITAGATPGASFGFQAGRAAAYELGEAVFGLAGAQLRAGRGQFLLHAGVTLEQRRQATQFVEQRKANGADQRALVVVDGQAHDHQRLVLRVEHVQQDGPAIAYHVAHQAPRDHRFAGLADGTGSVGQAKASGVAFVHPDDACLAVDDHRAFAGLFDDLEQRADRQLPYLGVVLEAVAVVHG